MIKCSYALEELPECGKEICCLYCEDKDNCYFKCEELFTDRNPEECSERIEEPDELEVMNKDNEVMIQEVTDLMIQVKKAEERISEIKELLLKSMEDNGVKKFENEKVSFTYVAPTTRKILDKKKLEKDHPELDLNQYQKESKVKASVRIKVK